MMRPLQRNPRQRQSLLPGQLMAKSCLLDIPITLYVSGLWASNMFPALYGLIARNMKSLLQNRLSDVL
jgi:hypothetical protein